MGELLLPSKHPYHPYITDDGRILRESEVNKHHVFWEKKRYQSKREQYFRNLGGLVIPMVITWHDDLHANLRPPQKPGKRVMDLMTDYITELEFEDPYVRFSQISRFAIRQAESLTHYGMANEMQKIGVNMLLQSAFIDKGSVRRLDDT
jgi:hypothetical protein